MNSRSILSLLAVVLLLSPASAAAFTPHQGDTFSYHEVTTVNNGSGSYAGYSDQTVTNGSEQITRVSGSTVTAHYGFTYVFSNNQQTNTTTASLSGFYTFNGTSFLYINGTDNQEGYTAPMVWFAMNNSLPVGAKFTTLNTKMTVVSKDFPYADPALNENIRTIYAQGSGSYQRNDSYGVFTATYTWEIYFDPATGYIVGYHYVEQDNGQYQGQAGSFTYTDDLYVTQTSYPLSVVTTSSNSTSTGVSSNTAGQNGSYIIGLAVVAVFVLAIVLILIIAFGRRSRRSKSRDSGTYTAPPENPPAPPAIDLTPKEQPPVQQIVIRDVAMVNCKFCGTLIPSTDDVCPHCGAPRT